MKDTPFHVSITTRLTRLTRHNMSANVNNTMLTAFMAFVGSSYSCFLVIFVWYTVYIKANDNIKQTRKRDWVPSFNDTWGAADPTGYKRVIRCSKFRIYKLADRREFIEIIKLYYLNFTDKLSLKTSLFAIYSHFYRKVIHLRWFWRVK